MAVSSKEDLLGTDVRSEPVEVELPSGRVVEVRSITLDEYRTVLERMSEGAMPGTAYLIAGLVAPDLTEEEVAAWVAVAPAGDPVTAFRKIEELSGLAEGAAKSAYKSVRRRSQS